MGGKNAAAKEATRARAEEEARQARIRQGTAAVNRTFDGGTVGSGAVGADAAYDATKTYYLADGTAWTPPAAGGGGFSLPGLFGGGGSGGAPNDAAWKKALQDGLFSGTETRAGFNNGFFDGIRGAFMDFARPKVDDQFREAGEQSTFNLARSGTLDSSMRGEQNAKLQKMYDTNLQDITDQARGYETEARNNVERSRNDLISMLQVTGDATGAANSALNQASTLATPPTYSPIGQLFQDSTAMLGQQMAQERAFALGLAPRPRNSTGLFSSGGGSVKVS